MKTAIRDYINNSSVVCRGVSGVRGRTLIINLPGSMKGALEMAMAALPGVPHAVALMRGDNLRVKKAHAELQASHHHGGHHHSHSHHSHHNHPESKVSCGGSYFSFREGS